MPPGRPPSRLQVAAIVTCLFANVASAAQCVSPVPASLGLPMAVSLGAASAAEPVVCRGAAPAVGQSFEGIVVEVFDGHTLCVARGFFPSDWILVQLTGAPGTSTRQTLMAASFARQLTCLVGRSTLEGVGARCMVGGAPLEQVLATKAARQEGLAWR